MICKKIGIGSRGCCWHGQTGRKIVQKSDDLIVCHGNDMVALFDGHKAQKLHALYGQCVSCLRRLRSIDANLLVIVQFLILLFVLWTHCLNLTLVKDTNKKWPKSNWSNKQLPPDNRPKRKPLSNNVSSIKNIEIILTNPF